MVGRIIGCAAMAIAAAAVAPLQQVSAAPPASPGETIFRQRCQVCHTVAAGKPGILGPNLRGVVNRKAASAPGTFRYSDALRKSGLTWNPRNLDKFLAGPVKLVPGTRMVMAVPDASQRASVVAYLATVK